MPSPPTARRSQIRRSLVSSAHSLGVKDVATLKPVQHRKRYLGLAVPSVGEALLEAVLASASTPLIGVTTPRMAKVQPDVEPGYEVARLRNVEPASRVARALEDLLLSRPPRHPPSRAEEPPLPLPPRRLHELRTFPQKHVVELAELETPVVNLLLVVVVGFQSRFLARTSTASQP